MKSDPRPAASACGFALALLLLPCCAFAASPPATRPAVPGILALGSHDQLWVAETSPEDQAKGLEALTMIRGRPVQSGQWKGLAHFNSLVVALAEQNDTLIAVQEDGQWLRIGDGQFSNGLPLPFNCKILAMAGGENDLWAIGFGIPGGPSAASLSATAPVSPPVAFHSTTAPASMPLALRPMLFRFTGNRWNDVAGMPDNLIPADAPLVSMIVSGDGVAVAQLAGDTIRTFRFDRAKASWADTGSVKPGFAVRVLKLIPTPDNAALWAAGANSAGELRLMNPKGGWSSPAAVAPPPGGATITDATAAAAGDEIRVIVSVSAKDGPQFFEQKYRFDGGLTQRFTLLPWSGNGSGGTPSAGWWLNMAIMAVLLFLMFSSIRRRRAAGPVVVDLEKLGIAPLGLRLLAGSIDLLPLAAALVLYAWHIGEIRDASALVMSLFNDPHFLWWWGIASAIYVGHTLAAEIVWGRSIGKIIVGLDVVRLDGARPAAWPMALRNLLRFIDLSFYMLPLALIFLSPVRQRVGDAAAGTVVVVKRPAAKEV